ncbi:N-acetylmuramic acid 6-phosphate etherase [candidate division GN15 bacterium]|nr:N-acetylmuramic acid 6-phosphate etherase [candidate division GN15 bacterium]
MTDYQELMNVLARLSTEQVNPRTLEIDTMTAEQIVQVIHDEDRLVADIVARAKPAIARTAHMFATTLEAGGRVFYIGAGTSGRLGVLDAAECPPTFGTEPGQIVGVISGGYDTLILSREGVEDQASEAVKDLKKHELIASDMVIGVAASVRTPYTREGLTYARSIGCRTAFLICNDAIDLAPEVDELIVMPVGPEVITGSTRMKAGTACKMALNMISTTGMVLLGKTMGNLMVDLKATSEKLAARSRKMLMELLSIDQTQAESLLERSEGSVKVAIVMHRLNCDLATARSKLTEAGGFVRQALQ